METMKKSLLIIKVIILTGSHAFGQGDLQKSFSKASTLGEDSVTIAENICYLTVYPESQLVSGDQGTAYFIVGNSLGQTRCSLNVPWCNVSMTNHPPNDTLYTSFSINDSDTVRYASIQIHKMSYEFCGPMDVTVVLYQDPDATLSVTQLGSKGEGIGENSLADLEIYPNPFNGPFTIGTKGNIIRDLNVSISDINGRTILSQLLSGQAEYHFDLSSEPEGIYFIRIMTEAESRVVKWVLTK
jgi:hypothetical protein